MKKVYIFLLLAITFSFGFSQSPIVVIDRDNIPGPTATGTDATISAIGLSRGAGVVQRNGTDFSSRLWTETSLLDAQTNNDYIEWAVVTNGNYEAELSALSIRLRRNAAGPTDWQIFYSTDDFATSTALSTVQTLAAGTNVVYNSPGFSITAGISTTLKFRLYAWGATANSGWLRVRRNAAWTDFGIALPGIRISGTTTSIFGTSEESNIITTSFDPTDNIDYTTYTATLGLTTANAIKVAEFTIQDGGDDLTDPDTEATVLSELALNIANFEDIAAIALFDGSTNVSELTTVDATSTFVGINGFAGITAADEGSKTFSVYATFKNTVTDNNQYQFTIASATTGGFGISSVFEDFDAGGATTPIIGDDNRVEVTATQLAFNQDASDTNQFEVMIAFPSIIATDSNNNQDLDFANAITMITTGTFDAASTLSVNATNGESVFSNIIFSAKGTSIILRGDSSGLTSVISSTFDVNGPLINLAIQDFDGTTPEWTYTNNIPFFDNGWGTDGYYDIIDSASAPPLDNPQFSGNILGENDLNDEGDNGTTGYATITFATIDVSAFDNIKVKFDWDIQGYNGNNDDAQYRLILDGINQPRVFLLDGNGIPDSDQGHVSVDVSGTVNTVALEIRVRNNGLIGYSGFDNFRIVSEFDGLLYTDNAWTPNAPSGATGTDNALVLDGTYTVTSSAIEINNFIVNTGAATDIDKTSSLTVNGNLVANGTLELNSDSDEYSSLIVEGVAEGDVVYKRHTNNTSAPGETDSNDLIAPPVSGEAFDVFRENNANIVSNGTGTMFLFGPFDKVTGTYLLYTDTETATLDAGNGYRAASTDSDTFTFTGEVITGTISKTISVSPGTPSPEWNLIGNPYTSYLKLDDFLFENNAEFDPPTAGIYGYDGDASDGWIIWNQAYSDANPTAVITPGQGFLVSSKAGGGTINFTSDMRAIGSTDDFIAGRSSEVPENGFVTLSLNTAEKRYNTNLYFNANASLGMDNGYDAAIFGNNAPNFAIYSHLVEDNTDTDMAVQSVSYTDLENTTIPLGINVAQGEQVTVSITNSNIPEDTDVFLEDNLTNTFTDLKSSDYTFTPSTTLTETGRFFIHFSREQLTISESTLQSLEIYTNTNPKTIIVKGQLSSETELQVFDIQGRIVNTQLLNTKDTKHSVDVSNLSAGIYVVQLQSATGNRTQKVILR